MANNCLVKKLKGVVYNDNLKFFDTILIKENQNCNFTAHFDSSTGSFTIEVIGDGTIKSIDETVDYGTSITTNNISLLYKGSGKLKISNKSCIESISININGVSSFVDVLDYDDLYFNSLKRLNLYFAGSGDIANVLKNNTELNDVTLTISGPKANVDANDIYGDFSIVSDSVMASITKLFFYSTNISGDISTFGRCINLNQISFANTLVTGTVESFVQMARSKGRTEFANSEQKNWYFNSNITFNGVNLTAAGYNDFSWTENTITLGGVTINA